jgi:hypothetical protein
MTNLRSNLEEELVEYLANCSDIETVMETLNWVLLSSKQKELIEHLLGLADRELLKVSEEEFPVLLEKLITDILKECGVNSVTEEIAWSLYPYLPEEEWTEDGLAFTVDGNEQVRNGFIVGLNYQKNEL